MRPFGSALWTLRRLGSHALFEARRAAGLGAFPDTLVIGAPKSGTTSLFAYLAEHPDVCASRMKEPGYFDMNHHRGVNWYRAQFHPRPNHKVRIEASPLSLFHPRAPERVREAIPDARLIAIFRDPVDRAYSHYNQSVALGFETLSFEEAVAAEPDRIAGLYEQIERGDEREGETLRRFSYVTRSLYSGQLERWLARFPRHRFLFIKAEDMFASPRDIASDVQRFLDLPPVPLRDARPRNSGGYRPLDAGVRERLKRLFAGPNAEFKRLTGIEWT